MRFVNPIPFVRDMDRSKAFYGDLLGLAIVEDHGDFVLFEGGFAVHLGASLERTIWGKARGSAKAYGRANLLLYFEHDDVDEAYRRIAPHADVIHPVERQAWGQRVFRFHDPDGHAVEVGEPMTPAGPS